MPDQSMPYLCGGVFISQLMNARKDRFGVREHYAGDSDGLSDPDTMAAYIRVMNPNFVVPAGNTFKENTSSYKNCRKNCSIYLPFSIDSAVVRSFDECVRGSYRVALSNMTSFTKDFLETGTDEKKDEYLVKALVEIIKDDTAIPEEAVFYINEDGSPSTKAQLLSTTTVCFQAFLIGVWHFILFHRTDNTLGRDTILNWRPTYSDARIVSVYCAPDSDTTDKAVSHVEPVVEPHEESDTPEGQNGSTTQTMTNPSIFYQYGNNGIQIGSIGTLTINHNEKKGE